MDTVELLATVRNTSKLQTENEIGTPLLKRYLNLGQDYVSQILMPLFHEFLVKSVTKADQTGSAVPLPGDVMMILDVLRETASASNLMKVCARVPVQDKAMIGRSLNYPNSADYPCFVHEGVNLFITPTMATCDVILRYRKRMARLIEGTLTYVSATSGNLSVDAEPTNDVYNDYDLGVYTVDADMKTLLGIYKISAYAGSTKTVTLVGSALSPSVKYYYALAPMLPAEYHNFIVDATMMELMKANLVKGDFLAMQKSLDARLEATLKVNGVVRPEFEKT